MAIDPGAIITGVSSQQVMKLIDQVTKQGKDSTDLLKDIHDIARDFSIWYKGQQDAEYDTYRYVVVYKANQGGIYIPDLKGYKNVLVFSPVASILNASASGLLPFNLNLAAASWNVLNFPDGTGYTLDASFGSNSLNLWQRLTNAQIV